MPLTITWQKFVDFKSKTPNKYLYIYITLLETKTTHFIRIVNFLCSAQLFIFFMRSASLVATALFSTPNNEHSIYTSTKITNGFQTNSNMQSDCFPLLRFFVIFVTASILMHFLPLLCMWPSPSTTTLRQQPLKYR